MLPVYSNVRPAMKKEIPWPWKTFGLETCPEIIVPDLCSYYDFQTFMIEDCLESNPMPIFGTRNFKAVFATACRYLGLTKVLETTPNLHEITSEYEKWNRSLIRWSPVGVTRFICGDILADEYDPYMKPDLFRSWLLPEYRRLRYIATQHELIYCLIFSGDISSILEDLLSLEPDQLAYEPVGGMMKFFAEKQLDGCQLFPTVKA
jgi:hypothetical protein